MRRLASADRLAGLVIILFGAWFLWQATELRQGPGYAAVGPRVFPTVVGCGLLASGLALLLVRQRRADEVLPADTDPAVREREPAADWPTLVLVVVLLAGYIVLFRPLGFVIASSLFLVGGAWALGSRAPLRDLVAGILLSVVVYAVFTRLLTLELPGGPIEAPLRGVLDRVVPRL